MTSLGLLEDLRPGTDLAYDRIAPPSHAPAEVLARGTKGSANVDAVLVAAADSAKATLARAQANVAAKRTSTTLVALAQSVSDAKEATDLARDALSLALAGGQVTDPISARMAADLLLSHGEANYVLDALQNVMRLPRSLTMTLVAANVALERIDEAKKALSEVEGSAADAFRGYLAARTQNWQQAVTYLRSSLRVAPQDTTSLLNLSVALWNLGATTKAIRAAAQAAHIAPERKDVSLHFLELLLTNGDLERFEAEVESLNKQGIAPDPDFFLIQGRGKAAQGQHSRALTLFVRAEETAKAQGDNEALAAALAHQAATKFDANKITRAAATALLAEVLDRFPTSDAALLLYAQIATRRSDAGPIRGALKARTDIADVHRAYLNHQLAILDADIDAAARAAEAWFDLERDNPSAATAAITSVGIGQERWADAAAIADHALDRHPTERPLLNNAAYVYAMSGRSQDAINLLNGRTGNDCVLKATLGLAYLANDQIDEGMRLYREAADLSERVDPALRSLMTSYQALVVRILGIDKRYPLEKLEAIALAPIPLPDGWEDVPDFIRLQKLAELHGYEWPLAL